MAKKGKSDSSPRAAESAGLKHNPFAALAAKLPSTATTDHAGTPPEPERTPVTPTRVAAAPASSPTSAARPPAAGPKPTKSRGRLVLRRETKHRGGKAVIIVRGFAALPEFGDESKLAELAKELKQKLGCGGTVEHGDGETELVLQGDRAAKVAELLRAHGFRVDGVTS
jgi:translation initiation factor 1 (eIF-1/SUI1)